MSRGREGSARTNDGIACVSVSELPTCYILAYPKYEILTCCPIVLSLLVVTLHSTDIMIFPHDQVDFNDIYIVTNLMVSRLTLPPLQDLYNTLLLPLLLVCKMYNKPPSPPPCTLSSPSSSPSLLPLVRHIFCPLHAHHPSTFLFRSCLCFRTIGPPHLYPSLSLMQHFAIFSPKKSTVNHNQKTKSIPTMRTY